MTSLPRPVPRRRGGVLASTILAIAGLALSGCTGMSGLSGGSNYACKAPDGVTCESVSGTYANAVQNRLPGQRQPPGAAVDPPARPLAMPLRSSARILRLWFKPWEDADGDLYDQGYVYVEIDGGRWLIDHAQRRIRDAYAPLRPPPRSPAPTAETRDAAATPRPAGAFPGPVAPVPRPSEGN